MGKQIIHLLDLDLDFFQHGKFDAFKPPTRRPSAKHFPPWKEEQVIHFLEKQCGLDPQNKIPGKFMTNHHELFYFMRDLQTYNYNNLLFSVDHVDAHSDTGFQDSSYEYIWSDLLFLPVSNRQNPKKGGSGLTDANFLSFALACQWIHKLQYINEAIRANDINPQIFQNVDISTNFLQLRKYNNAVVKSFQYGDFYSLVRSTTPISLESEVPFSFLDSTEFQNDQPYQLISLTQSPGYSSKKADPLIPIIRSYMDEKSPSKLLGEDKS